MRTTHRPTTISRIIKKPTCVGFFIELVQLVTWRLELERRQVLKQQRQQVRKQPQQQEQEQQQERQQEQRPYHKQTMTEPAK
jgi:adenylate kinase